MATARKMNPETSLKCHPESTDRANSGFISSNCGVEFIGLAEMMPIFLRHIGNTDGHGTSCVQYGHIVARTAH
jgi:hypothetical protein